MPEGASKTLVEAADAFLSRKASWDVDLDVNVTLSGVKIGKIGVSGRVTYTPTGEEKK